MIFLLLNVIFASAFMLFIKWAQVRGTEDVVTIGAINYIVAAVLIAPLFFSGDSRFYTSSAVWTGGTMGLAYFIAYFFVIFAIRWVGASAATVISVLSILLPITAGILIWHESPNNFQIVGIALALTSLLMIGGQKKKADGELSIGQAERPWFAPIILVIFFLLCGISRLAQEAFKHWCTVDEIMTFNFAAFTVAAVPSAIVLLARRKAISRNEFLFGVGMGLVNFLQTQFILESLQRFDGFIVFPVVSAGGIILTTLVATQMLGEKLSRKTCVGITIAAVSLVLLKGLDF